MSENEGVGGIVKNRRGTIIASGVAFLATSALVVSAVSGTPAKTPPVEESATQQVQQIQEQTESETTQQEEREEALPITTPEPVGAEASIEAENRVVPVVVPVQSPTPPPPAAPAPAPVPELAPACSCPVADLDCTDFSSCSEAQAVYQCCLSQGKGDRHGLDRDKDGTACNTLCK